MKQKFYVQSLRLIFLKHIIDKKKRCTNEVGFPGSPQNIFLNIEKYPGIPLIEIRFGKPPEFSSYFLRSPFGHSQKEKQNILLEKPFVRLQTMGSFV